MALLLKVSNSLETLAEAFSAGLADAPGGVFRPEYIVTQTEGMNNWLKLQVAAGLGIAANLRFLKPNNILFQVYFSLDGPRDQVLAPDNLRWILFKELDTPFFRRRYPRVAAYYEDGDDLKRLSLAEQVADLFDQYQIYRPDMIREWNGKTPEDASGNWQRWLWARARQEIGARLPDKTALADYIFAALADPEKVQLLTQRLPRISLFGISILTAFHVDLFQALSAHVAIHFYLLNPAPTIYWYSDRSPRQLARWMSLPGPARFAPPEVGNALLTNWGKVIRDTFSLLFRHDDFLNAYDDAATVPPSAGTLLGKIQSDIFYNAVGEDRQAISAEDFQDGSVTCNACYTPAREVEVLYNYLVRLADTGRLRSPREVLVLVNDVNTYAPYIRAVFGAAPYRFPFTIADEHLTTGGGFFGALEQIMRVGEEDFKAEEVLQLLECRPVRERFGISRMDLIYRAVQEANIRFGVRGDVEDETVTVSWENGLKRIMYGIAMGSQALYAGDGYGFYPLDIAEGEQALELVRFQHFVRVLIEVTEARGNSRSLVDWRIYLEEAAERLLVTPRNADDPDYILFQQYLERLNAVADTLKDTISFRVFRESFVDQMASETRPGNFIGGGITFCSLIPMRSIPFPTVAMLGLSFNDFPRKERPVTFDLMRTAPRPGDRNLREHDRHLFLETLLSAKERLYISYLGRSPQDNSVQPPSALVDELLAYIKPPPGWVHVHPLHGFSAKYAGSDPDFYTYLGDRERAGKRAPALPEMRAPDFSVIELRDFIRFFQHPVRAYYNKVLDIYFREEALLVPDTEIFEPDYLQKWMLKNDLVLLPEGEMTAYRDRQVRLGNLPLRQMADLTIEHIREEIASVRALVETCRGREEARAVHLEMSLGGSLLAGDLYPVFGNRLLRASFSKNECRHCLEAYLLHLCAEAAGLGLETCFISATRSDAVRLQAGRPGREEAIKALTGLLAYYKKGHAEPLAYSPDFDIRISELADLTLPAFRMKLQKHLEPGGPPPRRAPDPYLDREYRQGFFDDEAVFEAYREYALAIYGPVEQLFPR